MTRETKIGLLVGLAFIIAVGILLSDHVSSTNESPTAPLQVAGRSLRSGLGDPSSEDTGPATRNPPTINPDRRVLTREEAGGRHTGGVVLVAPGRLDGGNNATDPVSANRVQPGPDPALNNPDSDSAGSNTLTSAERLRRDAAARGEELEPFAPNRQGGSQNGTSQAGPGDERAPALPMKPNKPTQLTYTAKAGDTLSVITTKAYGTNSKALRDVIVLANPILKPNRNNIIEGHAYVIPPQASTHKPTGVINITDTIDTATGTQPTHLHTDTASNIPSNQVPLTPGNEVVDIPGRPVDRSGDRVGTDRLDRNNQRTTDRAPSTATASVTYVVQPDDTLWSIAVDEVGSANAVATIKQLNADILNGSDRVRPNMKLRLPSKRLASAN